MPSIVYVENAMKKLNDYCPKYIAIRNVFTQNEINWQAETFSKKNILRMSVFGKNNFLQLFPNYKIVAQNTKSIAPQINGSDCYVQSLLLKFDS